MVDEYDSVVCIVGLGPAGIGAAVTLSKSTRAYRILCLDAGGSPRARHCSVLQQSDCNRERPCNMISGFGGCSLLGGGKVSDFPAGSGLASILGSVQSAREKLSEALGFLSDYVSLIEPDVTLTEIEKAEEYYGKQGFEFRYYDVHLYNQRELAIGYGRMMKELMSNGVSVHLNSEVTSIDLTEDGFKIVATEGRSTISVLAKYLVLGVGRLGLDFLRSLNAKLGLDGEENHLDVGVRLEFPTELVPDLSRPHGDLKLTFGDARTFCVCRDGKIAPYLLGDTYFADGHLALDYQTGLTNLGILVRLPPSGENEGISEEVRSRVRALSGGNLVYQTLSDFLGVQGQDSRNLYEPRRSIRLGQYGNVNQCFPEGISRRIKEAVRRFSSRFLPTAKWDVVWVFAPSMDYAGLLFPVGKDFSIASRLYMIGDCTGRFRGILQALCSGIICGESIIGDAHEK
ncbi:MAG: hypothetical protein ACE5KV_05570 [Thermoplasmata archaeon]